MDKSADLQYLSTDLEPTVELQFSPKARQKVTNLVVPLKEIPVKGAHTRGTRMATQDVKKIVAKGNKIA